MGLRWYRSQDAVTAIEFSLLAFPFVLFVIGIIELSLMFLSSALLQGAVADAARLIRTGQLQSDADPETAFQEALCDRAGVLMDCAEFQYQVETLTAFSEAEMAPELDDDGNLLETPFDPGGVSDVVMVRVTYLYPLMTPGIGEFFADYPGNKRLLMATTVMETEPYDYEAEE